MVSGGETSVQRVFANVRVLRRALLVCLLLVIGPTVVAVWAARTFTPAELPEWLTDQEAQTDAMVRDNALFDKELLKPRARGEFGPFLLVGPGDVSESGSHERCDVETSYGIGAGGLTLAEILSSPLAIPEFSNDGVSLLAGACDGVVISINGGWFISNRYGAEETADVGVLLISHLPFRVEWDIAADRTEYGKIDGYPVLIEHPIPGQIMNFPRSAYILFAEPRGDRPGVFLSVSHSSPEGASEAVISSVEKRISEMGLPPNPYN